MLKHWAAAAAPRRRPSSHTHPSPSAPHLRCPRLQRNARPQTLRRLWRGALLQPRVSQGALTGAQG